MGQATYYCLALKFSNMIKHEEKFCPRCNTRFECKVGSIDLCQCSAVQLNDAERNYIADKFHDCLCARCIEQIRDDYKASTSDQ
jgi:hypothetical protein